MVVEKVLVQKSGYNDVDPLVGDEVYRFDVWLLNDKKEESSRKVEYVLIVVPEGHYPKEYVSAAVNRAMRTQIKRKYERPVEFRLERNSFTSVHEWVEK